MSQFTQPTSIGSVSTKKNEPKNGNQIAVETLFKEHRQALHNYLKKWISCPEDVQEILQETWLHALKSGHCEKLQSPSGKSFLYTIATNLVRDRHRMHLARRYNHHESVDDDLDLLCSKPKPEDYVAYDEARDRLLEALKNLDPQKREVFVMHRFMDKGYAEIANILNISVRTVERHMASALQHCREYLQDHLS